MATKQLIIDVWQQHSDVVTAVEGEVNSRFLDVSLVDGEMPLDLTNALVQIYVTKPNGDIVYNEVEIMDAIHGKINIPLTAQMSTLSGISKGFEIRVISKNGEILKVVGPVIVVTEASPDEPIESLSEFTALTQAIIDLQDIKNSIENSDDYQDLQYIIEYLQQFGDTGTINTKLTALETKIAELTERISSAENEIYCDSVKLTTLEKEVASYSSRIGDIESNAADFAGKITTIEGKVSEFSGQISALSSDLVSSSERIEVLEDRTVNLDDMTTSIALLKSSMGDVSIVLDAINGEVI